MKVGIIGYGEVGRAIESLYLQPIKIKDLDREDDLSGLDLIHVCIPYSDSFVDTISSLIDLYKPTNTILHSTVAPHTTKAISQNVLSTVAHSPIRGVHPYLKKGILTFEKYIGCDTDCTQIEEHLRSLDIKTKKVSSLTSEVAKLFSTTYYGLCIAWHGEMKKVCDELGVDFDEAVTNWNQNYNDSYKKLGKGNVTRPVLHPPEKIGGHCVIPNTKILKKHLDSKAIDLILEYS